MSVRTRVLAAAGALVTVAVATPAHAVVGVPLPNPGVHGALHVAGTPTSTGSWLDRVSEGIFEGAVVAREHSWFGPLDNLWRRSNESRGGYKQIRYGFGGNLCLDNVGDVLITETCDPNDTGQWWEIQVAQLPANGMTAWTLLPMNRPTYAITADHSGLMFLAPRKALGGTPEQRFNFYVVPPPVS